MQKDYGDIVFDGKPSKVLSAGFLLPANRPQRSEDDEIGQANDAISPIHLATAGFAFQVAARTEAKVKVRLEGSVYVRMLPTDQEVCDRPIAFRLSRDLQRQMAELRREHVSRARASHEELLRARRTRLGRMATNKRGGGPLGARGTTAKNWS